MGKAPLGASAAEHQEDLACKPWIRAQVPLLDEACFTDSAFLSGDGQKDSSFLLESQCELNEVLYAGTWRVFCTR